jgi:hypothetical protein
MPESFDDKQAAVILRSLRTAIGIWLANCPDCNYDAMSIIQIGQKTWVRSDLVNQVFPVDSSSDVQARLAGNRMLARVETGGGGVEFFGEAPITADQRRTVASGSRRRRPRGKFFCDGSRGSCSMR